jgi:hypothetical protein
MSAKPSTTADKPHTAINSIVTRGLFFISGAQSKGAASRLSTVFFRGKPLDFGGKAA